MKSEPQPATRQEIVDIVGSLDDAVLLEILHRRRLPPRCWKPSPG